MNAQTNQALLRAAKAAYFRLLVLDSKTRHTSAEQAELCILRDSIADATEAWLKAKGVIDQMESGARQAQP